MFMDISRSIGRTLKKTFKHEALEYLTSTSVAVLYAGLLVSVDIFSFSLNINPIIVFSFKSHI